VIIDDYFPCTDDGYVCFSKANGNELWVLILEKAFAKLHGSYERIEGGYAHLVMRDLTGAPSYELCLEEDTFEDIWK
jgi:calpain-15